ncbi:glycosyltransferase family 4 protein [Hymenobacter tibetensis]|uniref:Glycosyltransferase family 4 protein n=1 Tax=Hymenobacter tibetensis TaxID=497967 RepID=A0ABY4CUH4_9BACT|nr:glycosyltransferase family 4 protein [Hymenobacter tibetensis]UOG73697.1 glycosyltransferase family 4 protein [Hymenobacter tibetensis]
MPTGGIESHLREFCLNLAESGAAVDLVIRNSAMLPETEDFFRRICNRVYLGRPNSSLGQLIWLSWIGLKRLTKRYDALYTNGQGNSVNLFARLLPRRRRWVHHHHTAGDAADQATWPAGYRNALRNADSIIACSSRNAKDMQQTLDRRVLSIPCFSREIASAHPEPGPTLRFGYYGRLIKEKGIDLLCQLSADPEVKGVEFHIWGEGETYSPEFFTRYPNLRYHGPFSGKEALQGVLTQLDAYLLLSTHPEGLPIALLEVMSAGLPWLATDRGGVPDIACDPMATRVIPTTASYEEVKNAVLTLATDIQTGRVSRSAQKALYAETFSAKVLVKRWRETLGIGPTAS